MYHSSERRHHHHRHHHAPPPVDRLYYWCRACNKHWDQATKPRCICSARQRASASWTTKFISSIPSFDMTSTPNNTRSDSPPLQYDQPMMPPVRSRPQSQDPSTIFPDPYDVGDPFTASPVYGRGRAVSPPSLRLPSPHHPLVAPQPLYPNPPYPISDLTHPDIPVVPPHFIPRQTYPISPPPHLYHNGNQIPTGILYADPRRIEDPRRIDHSRDSYIYGPSTSRYNDFPAPAQIVRPGNGWQAPAAEFTFE